MSAIRGATGSLFGTRRRKLLALLALTTVLISALAIRAAGSSLSYYTTPDEFASTLDPEGKVWRVGGRVVDGTIVEVAGRPVQFEIEGEEGERMTVTYDGIVPNLFGPFAFVVAEGTAETPELLHATSVVIKHENEFFSDTPPEDSPSRNLVPRGD